MTETLLEGYHRAQRDWPFIVQAEAAYALPDGLLFAVGWRETNLTNVVGDQGHGHGVWQEDDRSHTIPAGFDQDVRRQAITAAQTLASLLEWSRKRLPWVLAAYNAGQAAVVKAVQGQRDLNEITTGGDYVRATTGYLLAVHADHIAQLRSTHRVAGLTGG